MKIRYYADADIQEWHDHTLRLLRTVHNNHDILVEIVQIDEQYGPITNFPGEVRSSTPEDVYERDFKQNRDLAANISRPPSKVYKFEGDIDIAGHVAVVTDDVQWASTLQGDAYGHGTGAKDKTPIDFLADVSESPSNRICIECAHLLDGDETFCPACGFEPQ
ncbi:zinc ribbon domain-containing protein [Halovenus rubra]|uniref:Zinc ribbon domain-containing protein n=2 Tax=Halovenus rubra TaxID=869890 RepID=A0ABD5X886_9EURY|nr:zinc ribbon domain-containing protein [Halovenus rubra]